MTTMQQYLDYSTLSFASYGVELTATGNNDAALKDAKMTQIQIDQLIASGWEVVDQSKDSLYGESSPRRADERSVIRRMKTWYTF